MQDEHAAVPTRSMGGQDHVVPDFDTPPKARTVPVGEDRLLTQRDVAAYFKVTRRTIENWRDKGWLPFIRLGGVIRFKPSDLQRVVERRRVDRGSSR